MDKEQGSISFTDYKFGVWESLILFRHSTAFEIITSLVITFYAILLGVKVSLVSSPFSSTFNHIFIVFDYLISVFFVFELYLRIWSEPEKLSFFKDWWNLFDFIVILISLIPLSAFSDMMLLGRIVRIFRILRIITINTQLKKLVGILFAAFPPIINILLLMFVISYVFAIIGVSFFAEINPDYWGDLGVALLTLFRVLTLEGWTEVMYQTMEVYPASWAYYFFFIMINVFIVFNLFIAVIIEEINKQKDLETGNLKLEELILEQKITQLEKKIDLILKNQQHDI